MSSRLAASGGGEIFALFLELQAQVDPFAPPVWRSPVYHTPGWIITLVQLVRLLVALARFLARHPALDLVVFVLALAWSLAGWSGPVTLTATVAALLAAWRWRAPVSFSRFIGQPVRGKWRRWYYQRHCLAVLTIARLAPLYRGRLLLPVLGKVSSTRYTDRVQVAVVSGQAAADFAARAENLAHGFGALLCRVRTARFSWCWSSSAATPWPPSSPPSPSPHTPTSKRCRSGGGRTGRPGWSGCTALTCLSRARPAPGRAR